MQFVQFRREGFRVQSGYAQRAAENESLANLRIRLGMDPLEPLGAIQQTQHRQVGGGHMIHGQTSRLMLVDGVSS